MRAAEIKLALALAQSGQDLSSYQDGFDRLTGCGCSDFVPCEVPLGAVAKLLRYQCQYLNGGWDWAEYQNCRAILLGPKRVTVSDCSILELGEVLRTIIEPKLVGDAS